jgi:hypothetical protein
MNPEKQTFNTYNEAYTAGWNDQRDELPRIEQVPAEYHTAYRLGWAESRKEQAFGR